jgi:hypothetical protein
MAEFTDEIIRIIEKKDRTMETINNDLFQSLDPTQQTIFEAVKKHISKMETADGKIIFDEMNTDMVNEIDQIIANAIKRSKYPSSVQSYLSDWNTINEFNYTVHKDVNELSKTELENLVNPIQKQMTEQTLTGLTGSGVNTNFIEPIRQGIFQNIVAGSSITDLENYLTTYILGNPNVDGLFSRYVKQISRDSLNQYDGQINAKIAEEFGLDAFRYVGSLIDDSRPQCRRWVNMRVIQKKDLPNELSWATNNGTGMIPGTNTENFAVYRGGYNCRHSAIPFKLTKSQREKLGIEADKAEEKQTTTVDDQIAEVKKDNKTTQKEFDKAVAKQQLNEEYFISTQSPAINKAFFDLVSDQDGAAEIAAEFNTISGIVSPSQTRNTKKLFQNKPKVTQWKVLSIGKNSGGACTTDNSCLLVKLAKNQKIVGQSYDTDFKIATEQIEQWHQINVPGGNTFISKGRKVYTDAQGYGIATIDKNGKPRFFTMSSLTEAVDGNIAPTITHEFAHLIHNKVDPKTYNGLGERVKIRDLAAKLGVKLSDAPTTYGATNWSEFWTESWTAYTYAPKWFEAEHNAAFKLFENLLDEYQIDPKTIKQFTK